MCGCKFGWLVKLMENRLDLDRKLEVLLHLDTCDICREAVYQLARERDAAYFIYRPYRVTSRAA